MSGQLLHIAMLKAEHTARRTGECKKHIKPWLKRLNPIPNIYFKLC
jgi:hypothetical protein